ncbi:MAG TPA: DUF5777 family beta-barrel protein [Myxococcota bacterium]|nr:DUF5777 family beta-barrel protein [Myxococcota bacterium]
MRPAWTHCALFSLCLLTLPSAHAQAEEEESATLAADDDGMELESVDVASGAPQSSVGDWYGEAYPEVDRLLDTLTARTVRRGTFNPLIQHRTHEGALESPFSHFLGFDAGPLKVGLGVRYGLLDRWDVAVYRLNGALNAFNTYELDTRFQLLAQRTDGLDLAGRVGVTWFQAPGTRSKLGGFAQVMVSRLLAERLFLNLGVLGHSRSTPQFGDRKAVGDTAWSVAAQAGVEARLGESWAWDLEVTAAVAGWRDGVPIISTGPRYITSGHTFAVVLSNGQASSADGIVTNSPRFRPREWLLGFNITREVS